ncbi:MAG: nucleotidyltransferase domain-containing protein [Candidatus Kerfeldbacteria bacterium]|nr:nucleotidyltransferase domain-containing protein [Candidatus Kerfeldbacteria bacterium]
MQPIVLNHLKEIIVHHPVRQAYLFGSQARGTAGALSDIDIAVLFRSDIDQEKGESMLFVDLSQALHTDNIDIVNIETASPLLAHRAVLRGLPILDHLPHETALLKTKILHAYEDTRHLREIKQAAFV